MQKLTKTQVSVLFAYSSPVVLLTAVTINALLAFLGELQNPLRLLILSASFPLGLSIGRILYLKKSHVEIEYDDREFLVRRGGRQVAHASWRSYKRVSIKLDQYGRPNLRLYKPGEEDFVELPISKTGVKPQEFRNRVQEIIQNRKPLPILQGVEAS